MFDIIMIVGLVFCYLFGFIDLIEEFLEFVCFCDVWMYVDVCVGGYFVLFVWMNGVDVLVFDFMVKGVCLMFVDLYKYGYVVKGVFMVFYCLEDFWRY